jgi:hypothetical protein
MLRIIGDEILFKDGAALGPDPEEMHPPASLEFQICKM